MPRHQFGFGLRRGLIVGARAQHATGLVKPILARQALDHRLAFRFRVVGSSAAAELVLEVLAVRVKGVDGFGLGTRVMESACVRNGFSRAVAAEVAFRKAVLNRAF
ncbi:unnamed protein product [Mycena citricolor]|uniref:Uncharacterized protein n=1 Tax=Mycena citricolor TaxID=2018698 RepID=A0AAD2K1X1_9AGAR|nr:unnamed protein product [Mycena citricolor]